MKFRIVATGGLCALAVLATIFVSALLYQSVMYTDDDEHSASIPTLSTSDLDKRGFDLPQISILKPRERNLIAIVIENHEGARPYQRGLQDAVMVQEHFAEGFITRFIALFESDNLPPVIGPVRSLRPYLIESVLPYTSVFLHAGGSPEALDRVKEDDITSFNGLFLEKHFLRTDGVPAPHDLFLPEDKIDDLLEEEQWTTVRWPPFATGRPARGSGATTIEVNYYSSDHNVTYTYKKGKRHYERRNGKDINGTPKSIVILETDVIEIGPFGRLKIATVGSGRALVFRNGKVLHGYWERKDGKPHIIVDKAGSPIALPKGQIWLTTIDDVRRVEWE